MLIGILIKAMRHRRRAIVNSSLRSRPKGFNRQLVIFCISATYKIFSVFKEIWYKNPGFVEYGCCNFALKF